ncbi:hypothetical protein ABB02_00406 [Clostridiaceae bacterium JG1575]|nr:hypothetical protein ABB02_00406 [Clostridiaceae bacterium JG1575]
MPYEVLASRPTSRAFFIKQDFLQKRGKRYGFYATGARRPGVFFLTKTAARAYDQEKKDPTQGGEVLP